MTACIVGWSHLPFGKLEGETVESLIVKAALGALDHAGIGPEDVDEIVLGHFNAGFSPQDFTASLVFRQVMRFASSRRRVLKTRARPARQPCIRASRLFAPVRESRTCRRRRENDIDARSGNRQKFA